MCTRGYFIRVTSCSDFYRTKGFFCLTVMPSNPQNGSPVTVGAPCGHRQPPWKHLILNRGEKHKPNPRWLQWNEAKKCKPTFLRNSEKILEPTTAVSSNCITLSEETIHSPLHTCTHIELKHTCSPHTMEERPKSVTLSETNYAY